MEGGIFLLRDGGGLVKMVEREYEAEDRLQALLADYPDLLAGEQIDNVVPRKWLHIKREAGVPAAEGGTDRWSLDHLFLDQDAVPTFVEVKRSSDTRIRREVVGQMLDYAANATRYWPVDQMREHFAAACAARNEDPSLTLVERLGPEVDVEQFWEAARRNLREGRVRLLFVADVIPSELRAIVEFLNLQMSPAEVLAVEIRQYVGGDAERPMYTLVPRVIGQTEAAKQAKGTESALPPAESESDLLDRWPQAVRQVAWAMLETSRAQGYEVVLYTSQTGRSQWLNFIVPSSGSTPFSVSDYFLWVDLGNNVAQLREPTVNQEIRRRLSALAPWLPRINDPKKGAIGVPMARLDPQQDLDRFAEFARYTLDVLR